MAARTEAPIEALRTRFLDHLLARPLTKERQRGERLDRAGGQWEVFDIDGTREAARQRALPQTEERPSSSRRLEEIGAPGYRGRKRGQGVRTRTVLSQAHRFPWLGSFGHRGNGLSREELRRGLAAINRSLAVHPFPCERCLLRLDGRSGRGAVLADLVGFAFVTRGRAYTLLEHPRVQARLPLPPDQFPPRPESRIVRRLYDCAPIPIGPEGGPYRVRVATHQASQKKRPVGVTREGVVSELFFTHVPPQACTASDVVERSLHRGAFEPTLADEDREPDPDRWCSHCAWGQECWLGVSQWIWNLRLEPGHQLQADPMRTTAFAPAISPPPPRTLFPSRAPLPLR
ncbi:MAG TPA: hypothetical protein VGF67_30460 [Ktedonobacteraceae bacterium]